MLWTTRKLADYARALSQRSLPAEPEALKEDELAQLQQVLARLRTVTGHDFSRYKRGTVLRRLRRRMQVRAVDDLPAYLALLRSDPQEVQALFRELLIMVADEEQRILLFQIVRELLFNVVKHAGVKEAQVTLKDGPGGLTVTETDKGKGFDVAQVLARHGIGFGLHNVRERLHLFGGRLDVQSQPGNGTRITFFMPHESKMNGEE